MSLEGQLLDHKSLRAVIGKTADWNEIAKDCIAFANSTGGRLLISIEDGQGQPTPDQRIPPDLPDTLQRKLAERTVAAVPAGVMNALSDKLRSICARWSIQGRRQKWKV